jgi:hypothetical protein
LNALATGNWQLATGNWQLATGNWQLATGNWQLAGCHIPFFNERKGESFHRAPTEDSL